jgi:L-iditol 2-dehydrogenase
LKALVFSGPKSIEIKELPIPSITRGEILLKVKFAGICGTDIRIYNGTKAIKAPRIIGHEFSGEIVELGEGVGDYSVGDRVTVYPMLSCGVCYACKEGRTNICVDRLTIGYEIDGGFSQYIKIPASVVNGGNVIKLPDNVSFQEAAASEPVAAALNGINRAKLKPDQYLAVVGCGPIGLSHVQLGKHLNANVIAIEPQREKRELAMKMGAKYVLDPQTENLNEKISVITDKKGVDSLLLDVGIPSVIEQSLQLVKKGGSFILFAGCPHGSTITIDPNWIHYREIDFTGASASTPENHEQILDMVCKGHISIKSLITDELPFTQWRAGFDQKQNYVGLKTILNIEEAD